NNENILFTYPSSLKRNTTYNLNLFKSRNLYLVDMPPDNKCPGSMRKILSNFKVIEVWDHHKWDGFFEIYPQDMFDTQFNIDHKLRSTAEHPLLKRYLLPDEIEAANYQDSYSEENPGELWKMLYSAVRSKLNDIESKLTIMNFLYYRKMTIELSSGYEAIKENTYELIKTYQEIDPLIGYVDTTGFYKYYDKTLLFRLLYERFPFAVIKSRCKNFFAGIYTIATKEREINLLSLFKLKTGCTSRISISTDLLTLNVIRNLILSVI
ncbi:MAG: hypothetical protein ABRQ39_27585, partial [Candidatus Eremiobacterota bacterium]